MKNVGGATAIEEAEEGLTGMSRRTRLLRYEMNANFVIFYTFHFFLY